MIILHWPRASEQTNEATGLHWVSRQRRHGVVLGRARATVGAHPTDWSSRAWTVIRLRSGDCIASARPTRPRLIDGKNIVIEFRWADSVDQLPTLAAEFVRENVDIIFANSS